MPPILDYDHRTAAILAAGAMLLGSLVLHLYLRFVRDPWPHFESATIMTENEQEFFGRLTKAMPDAYFFPQVAMPALIRPCHKDGKQRMADFRRISQKRVDWAVYTPDLKLLCVVELDDRTHDPRKDAERDAMLESAGIQTIRWDSRRRPSIATIRKTLTEIRERSQ